LPTRFRDLVRVLADYNVDVVAPTSGSHWKAVRDGRSYPIPAHNGLRAEIPDLYIRGVCHCYGLDYAELRKKL
jgi:hypothetical protein